MATVSVSVIISHTYLFILHTFRDTYSFILQKFEGIANSSINITDGFIRRKIN